MLGLMASYRVRPHLLSEDRLIVRNGARTWVDVPLADIVSAGAAEHELPGVIAAVHHDGDLLLVGVSSRTNLELTLRGPRALDTHSGTVETGRVGLWVDDPRVVIAQLRKLADPAQAQPGTVAKTRSSPPSP